MKFLRHLVLINTLLLGLGLSIPAASAAPPAAPVPSAKDKCPVCGMFVSKYPDWVATVAFSDSAALYFDGARDLFTYYHNIQKYTPARKQGAITAITVKDYYSLKPIDARQAYFVVGSDVFGPMGKELIPFRTEADAREFLKDHKGKKIVGFGGVTRELLKSMD